MVGQIVLVLLNTNLSILQVLFTIESSKFLKNYYYFFCLCRIYLWDLKKVSFVVTVSMGNSLIPFNIISQREKKSS